MDLKKIVVERLSSFPFEMAPFLGRHSFGRHLELQERLDGFLSKRKAFMKISTKTVVQKYKKTLL